MNWKSVLVVISVALSSSLAAASPHLDSFASKALPQDPQWSLDAQPGSLEALARAMDDEPASHQWNPDAWDRGRAWDRIPDDDDLGHLIHGDDDGHGSLGICGVVPEPSTWLMLGVGVTALAVARIGRSRRIRFH